MGFVWLVSDATQAHSLMYCGNSRAEWEVQRAVLKVLNKTVSPIVIHTDDLG